ncbi:ABC transporter permease [Natrinema thermotolerans]|uniref:ABC transporter permease n=1 Tax=Natrinema thermotolerans TaxID=121872 RepID=A0AAF0T474_9EURY|nr:ABC transporter permease subunit [Natrinema thermotolerans]QCC59251.1 ABC transporter [Natrinema thermotolerans]WMT06214.1 ABC transporter permease [Natrinema thermotolerans]
MSALSVAKRDFLNVRRAKLVWIPALLYALFMLVFYWGQSSRPEPDFYMVLWSLAGIGGALVIPLVAIVAAYLSIAGERESGSIRYQLSLPVSRSDVVVGKLLARTGVVVASLLIAFAIGIVAAQVLVPDMTLEYDGYAAFVALTLLYALAYVAVAVAISAATASRSRAMSGAIGFFFVFNLGWNFLPVSPVQMARFVFEELGVDYSDALLDLIFSLSPTGAYLNGMKLVFPDDFTALQATTAGSNPFYIQGWFMLVILAGWIVVPLLLGAWQFRRTDLG